MRPNGPYGNELLWGTSFLEAYREPLEDLYLTPEFRDAARDVYFSSFLDGEHIMEREKRLCVETYEAADFYGCVYAFRFIVDDVARLGYSRKSALISIHAYMMLVDTAVLPRPAERHVPLDYAPDSQDAVRGEPGQALVDGAGLDSGQIDESNVVMLENGHTEASFAEKPMRETEPKNKPEGVVKKCSNCSHGRDSEYCGQMSVCDEWRYAAPTPDYYPTWSEMRGGLFGDYLSRTNDTYLS